MTTTELPPAHRHQCTIYEGPCVCDFAERLEAWKRRSAPKANEPRCNGKCKGHATEMSTSEWMPDPGCPLHWPPENATPTIEADGGKATRVYRAVKLVPYEERWFYTEGLAEKLGYTVTGVFERIK